jgi:2-methylcitrate dehydratase PrpD
MVTPASEQLAEFVTSVRFEDLPWPIVQTTRRILLDDLGSMIGGFGEPEVSNLGRALAAGGVSGTSTILGVGFPRVAAASAALANGTACCGLETDGGYRYASCHASSYVVPTALALAEATGASGRQLIEAIVAGYEVAARLAAATSLPRPLMPHGVWSAPGAAAAAARMLALDPAATVAAIELGAMLTTNSAFTGRFEGATVRNIYNGLGGQCGILTAKIAQSGIKVGFDAIEVVFGSLSGDRFDIARATEGLGASYAIGFHYHKRWACCGFVHPSLDAIAEMMAVEPIDPAEIIDIEIATFPEGAVLNDQTPPRPLAARHSVPWAAAALIVRGSLPPDAFALRALQDSNIRKLAGRIRVFHDNKLPSGFSNNRSARVRLTYRDGRERNHVCQNVQGDFSAPFPDSLIRTKFLSLTEPALGAECAARFADLVLSIDDLQEVSALTGLLSTQEPETKSAATGVAGGSLGVESPSVPMDYLDNLCAVAFAPRSAADLHAASVLLDVHAAAIEKGQRDLVTQGILTSGAQVPLQGATAESHALSNGLAVEFAINTPDDPSYRRVISAAALALAQGREHRRETLLYAVASGCEVARRLAHAVTARAPYGEAGLWGILGAAVACGLLKGFNLDRMRRTLNVAASLTLATPGRTDERAVAAVHAAEASFRGLLATTLVEAGYTGLRDGLGFTLGTLVGRQFQRNELSESPPGATMSLHDFGFSQSETSTPKYRKVGQPTASK